MKTTIGPALAGLLAMLALPGAAHAATLGTIPVDPTKSVTGTFAKAGTQTWTIDLQRGRYYAVRGGTGDYEDVVVRTPAGGVAAKFSMGWGDYNGDGTSFRATVTGMHTVSVTMPASCFGATPCLGQPGTTGSYLLSVGRDCPGTIPTPCAIAVGQTLHGLWLSYDADADYFRTRLVGGVSYAIALPVAPGGGEVDVEVDDHRGRALVVGSCCLVRFTAPASGTYYLGVGSGQGGVGAYDLSLSR